MRYNKAYSSRRKTLKKLLIWHSIPLHCDIFNVNLNSMNNRKWYACLYTNIHDMPFDKRMICFQSQGYLENDFLKFYMLFSSYFSMLMDLAKHFTQEKNWVQRSPNLHNNCGHIKFLKLQFYGIFQYLNYTIFSFKSIFGKYRRWKKCVTELIFLVFR